MRRKIILLMLTGATLTPMARAQPLRESINDRPAAPAASATGLEIHTNPFLSLHLLVRAVAAGRAEAPDIEGFEAAVAAAREISEDAGDRAWALIDSGLAGCANAQEARAWAGAVRENAERPNARLAQPARGPTELIEALAKIEPAFLERVWPGQQRAIEAATAHLRQTLLAKQRECIADAAARLGIADPVVQVPVFLVAHGPPPGGVTYRTRGGVLCIVDVSAHPGTALDEAVLHESLHALDAASSDQKTVLTELREQLRGDGSRPSAGWRDVPHTVIFAQAAATIRRVIDPNHADYGVAGGYYERARPAAEAVRPAWAEYLAGRLSREEVITRIVESYEPPEPAGP